MQVSQRRRTIALKIVYTGPGLSGKTTNLQWIHDALPASAKGHMVQLSTENERTLFFDYCPLQLGRIGGYQLRVHMFTVPGQSFYKETRRAVLQGADGVVFVADSSKRRESANQQALEDLRRHLDANGLSDIPVIFQWNKRDVADALPVRVLEASLNPGGAPSSEACSLTGEGVHFTQALALRAVLKRHQATQDAQESLAG
ncbi:MAG: GTPase domain-containing protein [Alphaproteobacteria bacterium]|nr:GTPase domain-containing protein [Alphaproteobacteria bacterium]